MTAQDNPVRGIAIMCLSMFFFVAVDTLARELTQRLAVSQILWVRFVIFAAIVVAIAGPRTVSAKLKSRRPWLQFVRSMVLVAEIAVFVLSFRYLPVADVHAVAAAVPLIVTALAVPVLGERVGWRRWIAVGVGFFAVLAIIRPGFLDLDWYHLLPVAGALIWAVYQVLIRLTAHYDGQDTTLLWTVLAGLAFTTLIGWIDWVWPSPETWLLLIAAGILGTVAHYTLILALNAAPASLLQPFVYTTFPWAVLLGLIFFGEFPDAVTIAGAAVLIVVGLYVMRREAKAGGG
ncbi:MAG: DMT family transporter [Rhodospirillaceae bacterium]|nr:DMT family transporter [Rhodospirillaceae bacterium]MYF85844.1 DMT family transporter [Rhodospirillaceae bacterium]MYH39081.1 DMT family transporter [Rhodospirillaceae bacterium]MYK13575.1 DMT family transporter [Rhodospirillaceae bacterium]MYK59013.1 DMT family transporter [Rhodospirillaceae bacterium]